MFHARPHLETHSRLQGHSAVGGAAYRLGLKLYDRRLKRAFDFRKRVAGDEVVFQTTVAPPGAPSWATDPLELWNRVEQAERRKDAQVARDYRVPLPLGLSDADVRDMAIEIATFIAVRLHTPVSIGVHRDAPITAFGAAKTAEQQGCHAHLYFPTRKILPDAEALADEQRGGSGMGEKLTFLSNKSTAGYFVEDINKLWAEAANRYTARVGLTADYDHRSYRRQGLKIRPQPRLGEAATALEREGHRTRRGDALREARVMQEVLRRASDRPRPAHSPAADGASPLANPWAPASPHAKDWNAGTPASESADAASGTEARTASGSASLTERFRELYFTGLEEGARLEETLVFRLVMLIDRIIQRLRRSGHQLDTLDKELAVARTARLDALADRDQWHAAQRERAQEEEARATVWTRMVKGMGHWMDPQQPIEAKRRAENNAQVEQQIDARVGTTERRVTDLEDEIKPVRRAQVEEGSRLKRALHDLEAAHESALPQLVFVSLEEERAWIDRYMPELLGSVPETDDRTGGRGRIRRPKVTPRRPWKR